MTTITHPLRLQCKEVVERVSELLDGALAPLDAVRLEQHLLVCPPCTLYVHQLRETIAIAGELRAAEVPDGGTALAALAAFRRWKAKAP